MPLLDRRQPAQVPDGVLRNAAGCRNTRVNTGSMVRRIVVSRSARARSMSASSSSITADGIVRAADHHADERAALRRAPGVDARIPERAEDGNAFAARHEKAEAVERPIEPRRFVPETDDGQRRRRESREARARGRPSNPSTSVALIDALPASTTASASSDAAVLELHQPPVGRCPACVAARGGRHTPVFTRGPSAAARPCTRSSMPPVNEVRCPPGAPIGAPDGRAPLAALRQHRLHEAAVLASPSPTSSGSTRAARARVRCRRRRRTPSSR